MGSECCKCHSDKNIQTRNSSIISSNSSYYTRRSRNNQHPLSNDRYRPYCTHNRSSLAIRQLTFDDVGNYSAESEDSYGTSSRLASIDLNVEKRLPRVPIFLKRLHDVTVKIGSRARFLVEIDSTLPLKVAWYHDNQILKKNDRLNFLEESRYFCLDVAWSLLQDEGHWTCIAENKYGCSVSSAYLTIIVPKAFKAPHFVEELKAILAQDGTISLECKVTGVPTPSLQWYKDGKKIKAGDAFALKANVDDTSSLGTYSCVAKNCLGQAFSSSTVHFNPEKRNSNDGSIFPLGPQPKFLRALRNVEVQIETPLTLSCQVVVPPWPKTIDWYNATGKVMENVKYKTIADGLGMYGMEIKSVEMMDDGEWKCVATSFFGIKAFTSCYVMVKFPKNYKTPKFLENLKAVMTPEGLVSFECKVIGYPTPQLKWLKDDKELKPGDVYQLTGTNSLGTYCCIAKNPMGEIRSTTVLTLEDIQSQLTEEERLMISATNQPPYFIKSLTTQDAKINDEFQFHVQVSAKPEPRILWYRDDEQIEENERISKHEDNEGHFWLKIKNLQLKDQAEWKCVAVNDYGQSVTFCFIKLVIPKHYKPPKFLEELKASFNEDGIVNLECKIIGVPQPELKWYKDGRLLKPGDMHKIVTGTDGMCSLGMYSCEAVNCMATVRSSATLLAYAGEEEVLNKDQYLGLKSLSVIMEERSSQLKDSTMISDKSTTYEDAVGVSFSFDGKEVSISLYETPDLTEEEAMQIVEMYANELTEQISEHSKIELPSLRFVKETITTGNILMEAMVVDVPMNENIAEDELKTDADVENSMMDDSAFVTNNSAHSEDTTDKNNSEFTHNILQTSQSYIEESITEKSRKTDENQSTGDEKDIPEKNNQETKNENKNIMEISSEKLKSRHITPPRVTLQKRKSFDSEDDSLHEFEKLKATKIKRKSDELLTGVVKNEKLSGENEIQNLHDTTISEFPGLSFEHHGEGKQMTALETIAVSINKIEEDLDRIQEEIKCYVQSDSSYNHASSVLQSLVISLGDIKNSLEVMQEGLSDENDNSTRNTNESILSALAKPVQEFKESMANIEYSPLRENDKILDKTTKSILNAVTQPLKQINDNLQLIENNIIKGKQIEINSNQVSTDSDSQKMIVILDEYNKELENLNALTQQTRTDLMIHQTNIYDHLKETIDQMMFIKDWSLDLHKNVMQEVEYEANTEDGLTEFNCALVQFLDTNINVIKSMLTTSNAKSLEKFFHETYPSRENLETTIKVTEHLSALTTVNFVREALNYCTGVSQNFVSENQANVLVANSECLKCIDDSVEIILNSLDTTEKCSRVETSYHKKKLLLSLGKLRTPMQHLQDRLHSIEKKFSQEETVSGVEIYELVNAISDPLQALRKEIAVIVNEYQNQEPCVSINNALLLVTPTLKKLQNSITTFHEIIFNKAAQEIDVSHIFAALNNLNSPLNELADRLIEVEDIILAQSPVVSDPPLGIRIVMQSVSNLIDALSDLQTDSVSNHSTSLILSRFNGPFVEVKNCLQEINDRFYEEDLEKINITMLKTLSNPFNSLQKELIEAAEVVTGELKYTLTDLQRTILTIQDQVSFEYGDEPASIEYNIMTLQTLIQPINVLKQHCIDIKRSLPSENSGFHFSTNIVDKLESDQVEIVKRIEEVSASMTENHKYFQTQTTLANSIHSTSRFMKNYKTLLLIIKNAFYEHRAQNDSMDDDVKILLHQLYSDFHEIEKSPDMLGDLIFELRNIIKCLQNVETNLYESNWLLSAAESLNFLTPIFERILTVLVRLSESDFQEDESVKCFIALLQSLNTIRTLQENVKNFQSSSNTDSIQVPMLLSFLNTCERLEIKISDLLFIIENFADRKIILDPQFYECAVKAFSTLNHQLIHLNKCLIDQSMSDDEQKEIPFESSINLFSALLAIANVETENSSLKQIQLIIKDGILNELIRLKNDILFNMSLIQTEDEISYNESDQLEENLNVASPDLFTVCTKSINDEIQKCNKYFDKMNKGSLEQKLKYTNQIDTSLESVFNILNFVSKNIPTENNPNHSAVLKLHKPILKMLQQVRQIKATWENCNSDILFGLNVDLNGETKILPLLSELKDSFEELKITTSIMGASEKRSFRENVLGSTSECDSEDFRNDLSSSTDTDDFVTVRQDHVELSHQDKQSCCSPTFTESSSLSSDVFAENQERESYRNVTAKPGVKEKLGYEDGSSEKNKVEVETVKETTEELYLAEGITAEELELASTCDSITRAFSRSVDKQPQLIFTDNQNEILNVESEEDIATKVEEEKVYRSSIDTKYSFGEQSTKSISSKPDADVMEIRLMTHTQKSEECEVEHKEVALKSEMKTEDNLQESSGYDEQKEPTLALQETKEIHKNYEINETTNNPQLNEHEENLSETELKMEVIQETEKLIAKIAEVEEKTDNEETWLPASHFRNFGINENERLPEDVLTKLHALQHLAEFAGISSPEFSSMKINETDIATQLDVNAEETYFPKISKEEPKTLETSGLEGISRTLEEKNKEQLEIENVKNNSLSLYKLELQENITEKKSTNELLGIIHQTENNTNLDSSTKTNVTTATTVQQVSYLLEEPQNVSEKLCNLKVVSEPSGVYTETSFEQLSVSQLPTDKITIQKAISKDEMEQTLEAENEVDLTEPVTEIIETTTENDTKNNTEVREQSNENENLRREMETRDDLPDEIVKCAFVSEMVSEPSQFLVNLSKESLPTTATVNYLPTEEMPSGDIPITEGTVQELQDSHTDSDEIHFKELTVLETSHFNNRNDLTLSQNIGDEKPLIQTQTMDIRAENIFKQGSDDEKLPTHLQSSPESISENYEEMSASISGEICRGLEGFVEQISDVSQKQACIPQEFGKADESLSPSITDEISTMGMELESQKENMPIMTDIIDSSNSCFQVELSSQSAHEQISLYSNTSGNICEKEKIVHISSPEILDLVAEKPLEMSSSNSEVTSSRPVHEQLNLTETTAVENEQIKFVSAQSKSQDVSELIQIEDIKTQESESKMKYENENYIKTDSLLADHQQQTVNDEYKNPNPDETKLNELKIEDTTEIEVFKSEITVKEDLKLTNMAQQFEQKDLSIIEEVDNVPAGDNFGTENNQNTILDNLSEQNMDDDRSPAGHTDVSNKDQLIRHEIENKDVEKMYINKASVLILEEKLPYNLADTDSEKQDSTDEFSQTELKDGDRSKGQDGSNLLSIQDTANEYIQEIHDNIEEKERISIEESSIQSISDQNEPQNLVPINPEKIGDIMKEFDTKISDSYLQENVTATEKQTCETDFKVPHQGDIHYIEISQNENGNEKIENITEISANYSTILAQNNTVERSSKDNLNENYDHTDMTEIQDNTFSKSATCNLPHEVVGNELLIDEIKVKLTSNSSQELLEMVNNIQVTETLQNVTLQKNQFEENPDSTPSAKSSAIHNLADSSIDEENKINIYEPNRKELEKFKIQNESIDSVTDVYWDSKECVPGCILPHDHLWNKFSQSVSEQESFDTAVEDLETSMTSGEISECENISFDIENIEDKTLTELRSEISFHSLSSMAFSVDELTQPQQPILSEISTNETSGIGFRIDVNEALMHKMESARPETCDTNELIMVPEAAIITETPVGAESETHQFETEAMTVAFENALISVEFKTDRETVSMGANFENNLNDAKVSEHTILKIGTVNETGEKEEEAILMDSENIESKRISDQEYSYQGENEEKVIEAKNDVIKPEKCLEDASKVINEKEEVQLEIYSQTSDREKELNKATLTSEPEPFSTPDTSMSQNKIDQTTIKEMFQQENGIGNDKSEIEGQNSFIPEDIKKERSTSVEIIPASESSDAAEVCSSKVLQNESQQINETETGHDVLFTIQESKLEEDKIINRENNEKSDVKHEYQSDDHEIMSKQMDQFQLMEEKRDNVVGNMEENNENQPIREVTRTSDDSKTEETNLPDLSMSAGTEYKECHEIIQEVKTNLQILDNIDLANDTLRKMENSQAKPAEVANETLMEFSDCKVETPAKVYSNEKIEDTERSLNTEDLSVVNSNNELRDVPNSNNEGKENDGITQNEHTAEAGISEEINVSQTLLTTETIEQENNHTSVNVLPVTTLLAENEMKQENTESFENKRKSVQCLESFSKTHFDLPEVLIPNTEFSNNEATSVTEITENVSLFTQPLKELFHSFPELEIADVHTEEIHNDLTEESEDTVTEQAHENNSQNSQNSSLTQKINNEEPKTADHQNLKTEGEVEQEKMEVLPVNENVKFREGEDDETLTTINNKKKMSHDYSEMQSLEDSEINLKTEDQINVSIAEKMEQLSKDTTQLNQTSTEKIENITTLKEEVGKILHEDLSNNTPIKTDEEVLEESSHMTGQQEKCSHFEQPRAEFNETTILSYTKNKLQNVSLEEPMKKQVENIKITPLRASLEEHDVNLEAKTEETLLTHKTEQSTENTQYVSERRTSNTPEKKMVCPKMAQIYELEDTLLSCDSAKFEITEDKLEQAIIREENTFKENSLQILEPPKLQLYENKAHTRKIIMTYGEIQELVTQDEEKELIRPTLIDDISYIQTFNTAIKYCDSPKIKMLTPSNWSTVEASLDEMQTEKLNEDTSNSLIKKNETGEKKEEKNLTQNVNNKSTETSLPSSQSLEINSEDFTKPTKQTDIMDSNSVTTKTAQCENEEILFETAQTYELNSHPEPVFVNTLFHKNDFNKQLNYTLCQETIKVKDGTETELIRAKKLEEKPCSTNENLENSEKSSATEGIHGTLRQELLVSNADKVVAESTTCNTTTDENTEIIASQNNNLLEVPCLSNPVISSTNLSLCQDNQENEEIKNEISRTKSEKEEKNTINETETHNIKLLLETTDKNYVNEQKMSQATTHTTELQHVDSDSKEMEENKLDTKTKVSHTQNSESLNSETQADKYTNENDESDLKTCKSKRRLSTEKSKFATEIEKEGNRKSPSPAKELKKKSVKKRNSTKENKKQSTNNFEDNSMGKNRTEMAECSGVEDATTSSAQHTSHSEEANALRQNYLLPTEDTLHSSAAAVKLSEHLPTIEVIKDCGKKGITERIKNEVEEVRKKIGNNEIEETDKNKRSYADAKRFVTKETHLKTSEYTIPKHANIHNPKVTNRRTKNIQHTFTYDENHKKTEIQRDVITYNSSNLLPPKTNGLYTETNALYSYPIPYSDNFSSNNQDFMIKIKTRQPLPSPLRVHESSREKMHINNNAGSWNREHYTDQNYYIFQNNTPQSHNYFTTTKRQSRRENFGRSVMQATDSHKFNFKYLQDKYGFMDFTSGYIPRFYSDHHYYGSRIFSSSIDSNVTPRFKSMYAEDRVPVGATVTLHVEVEGTPKPNIEWVKDGKTLLPIPSRYSYIQDVGLHTLVITDISYNEAGMYKCKAWNKYGYADASTDINVVTLLGHKYGKPPMFISRPKTIISVNSGSDLSVSFRLSGDPKPKVQWMKGLTDITETQRTLKETVNDYTRLTLKRTHLSDAGTYFIIVKNIYGSDRAFFTLRVNQRSRSLTPVPLYQYEAKNYYYSNDNDTRKSLSYINKVPERIPTHPYVSDCAKHRITLTWPKPTNCEGAGILVYRIESLLIEEKGSPQWIELGTTPATSFDIYNSTPGKQYKFRVTPRNQYGWGESVATSNPIIIEDVPEFPEFEKCLPGELYVLLGSTVELECKVKHDKGIQFQWHHDGVLIENNNNRELQVENGGSFLKIKNATDDDTGRYVCEAFNIKGRISTFVRLIVVTNPKLIQTNRIPNRGTCSVPATNTSDDVSRQRELTPVKGLRGCVAPTFVEKLQPVYSVPEDSQLRIRTRVQAYPTADVTWQRNGVRLRPSRRLIVTVSQQGEIELTIAHVRQQDSGIFTCTATNQVGQAETNTRIEVYPKDVKYEKREAQPPSLDTVYSKEPKFLVKPRSCEAVEGDHVVIECKIVGDPKPNVQWLRDRLKLDYYRDCDEFEFSSEESEPFAYKLEIPRVKFDHIGAYTILAENEHGQAKAIVSLQVYTKDSKKATTMKGEKTKYSEVEKIPRIKRHLTDAKCCDGDSITFDFEIDTEGDSSDIDFHWYKNGKLIPLGEDFVSNVNGNVASFIIKQVYPEDEGQYSCIVSNNLGTATTAACLIVNAADETENIIDRELNRPSCLRSRSTTPIRPPYKPLTKENIHAEKSDQPYRSKRSAPKFYSVPHNRVAEEGDTVRFQCAVIGHPSPSTLWDKNDVPITSSARVTMREQDDLRILEISSVTYDDEGLYRIVVENDRGQCEATARLNVINNRRRRRNSLETKTYEKHFGRHAVGKVANVDGKCAISCSLPNAFANSSATWYKNGEVLRQSENVIKKNNDSALQLHFNNLTLADSGVYTCILENKVGKTRCSAELIVLDDQNSKNMNLKPPIFTMGIPQKSCIIEGECFQFGIKLQGALPIYVTWFKNDIKLPDCDDFQYIDHGHGEFSLKLNDTFLADTGVYKCEAYNCHGDAVSVGHLIVTEASECDNHNFPEPIVALENDKICNNNVYASQNEKLHNANQLCCCANETNGVGNDAKIVPCRESHANLSKPVVVEGPADVTVLRGKTVSLRVKFEGCPAPSVKWTKAGRELVPGNRIFISTNNGESVLKLDEVTADDGGKYEIIMENVMGIDTHIASLAVEGSPDAPNGQPNSVAGERNATVTWCSPPYDGGSKITGYTIEMRSYSNSQWRRVIENCQSLFCTVRGLTPGESYIFRIRAENVYGLSSPSMESAATYITHADVTSPIEQKRVSIQNGELFNNQYEVLEELGKGRYGIVHKIRDKEFGNFHAAKFIRCIQSKDKEKVREEIAIMNLLTHPKLLQLISAYEYNKEVIMVTEYISGGELFERVVADDFTLTERDCILFMRQICEGVAYIHKNNVVHLDLKPENIMCVSRTSHQIKLIDFGLAQKISPGTPVRVLFGTPEFIPPEIINYEPIGTESDMWSVGVICYVLLSGLSPFMGENDAETFANITRGDFDFDDEAFEAISKDAKDFISSLLIKRKEKRLTAKQCLHHKWLAQHDKTMSCVKLCTDKLKKFIIRRKWQKTGNAIRALGRMATLSNSRRNSSTNSSSSSSPRVSMSGAYSSRMSSLGEDISLLADATCSRPTEPECANGDVVTDAAERESPGNNTLDYKGEGKRKTSPKSIHKTVAFKDTVTSELVEDTFSRRTSEESSTTVDTAKESFIRSNLLSSNLRNSSCNDNDREKINHSSASTTSKLLSNVVSKITKDCELNKTKKLDVLNEQSDQPLRDRNTTITRLRNDSMQHSTVSWSNCEEDGFSLKSDTTNRTNKSTSNVANNCGKETKLRSGLPNSHAIFKTRESYVSKITTKSNTPSKFSEIAKNKTAERLKKFEQLTETSNCAPKIKKETFIDNKTSFQKAVAFFNRQ